MICETCATQGGEYVKGTLLYEFARLHCDLHNVIAHIMLQIPLIPKDYYRTIVRLNNGDTDL